MKHQISNSILVLKHPCQRNASCNLFECFLLSQTILHTSFQADPFFQNTQHRKGQEHNNNNTHHPAAWPACAAVHRCDQPLFGGAGAALAAAPPQLFTKNPVCCCCWPMAFSRHRSFFFLLALFHENFFIKHFRTVSAFIFFCSCVLNLCFARTIFLFVAQGKKNTHFSG